MFKSIDLFAGIGGIRLGFEQAFKNEIETVFVSEWDENAQKTYQTNFKDNFSISGDITKISENDVPEFDICLAGFPCQAFSLAGKRKGFADDYKGMSRGTLFFDVARICAVKKPKVIFCENVKGLTIHDKGRTFEIIVETLREIGYTVFEQVLNSRDFGVPQNRERIYIVAFRNDIAPESFDFPLPIDSNKKIRDILEEKPVPAKYYLSERYLETLKRHKAKHEALGHGFGYEIRSLDDVSGAIVCGGMGRERNLVVDNRQKNLQPTTHIKGEINKEGIRKMTPREWARLQGFPDSYQLPLADVHLYKQFGNSVTVPVIKAIAEKIKEVLDKQPKIIEDKNEGLRKMTANKGEWAELYVLFKLLGEGKIYTADEKLNKDLTSYLEIVKIIREEVENTLSEYHAGTMVDIYIGGILSGSIPAVDFLNNAKILLDTINTAKGRSFGVQSSTEAFIKRAKITQIKAKSVSSLGNLGGKNDIVMQIRDPKMALVTTAGFSIKAQGEHPATLFNTAPASAFVYKLTNMSDFHMENINALVTKKGGKDKEKRIEYMKANGIEMVFSGNKISPKKGRAIFTDNLDLVRGDMQEILNHVILTHYTESGKTTKVSDICDILITKNPLSKVNPNVFYPKAIKDFLYATFAGMTASEPWDGREVVNGGFVVAKSDGDVLVYHTRDGESFRNYLFHNTKLDRPSSSENKGYPYAHVYKVNNEYYFDLNFQVRFIK